MPALFGSVDSHWLQPLSFMTVGHRMLVPISITWFALQNPRRFISKVPPD